MCLCRHYSHGGGGEEEELVSDFHEVQQGIQQQQQQIATNCGEERNLRLPHRTCGFAERKAQASRVSKDTGKLL